VHLLTYLLTQLARAYEAGNISVRLTDIMHPATLHDDRVTTKLYFAIFAAFKESMTFNLA